MYLECLGCALYEFLGSFAVFWEYVLYTFDRVPHAREC